jgi:hypothetical protein
MANYQHRPAGVSLDSYANAQRNASLGFNPSWPGNKMLVGTTGTDTGVPQPVDAVAANAVRHSVGQWP